MQKPMIGPFIFGQLSIYVCLVQLSLLRSKVTQFVDSPHQSQDIHHSQHEDLNQHAVSLDSFGQLKQRSSNQYGQPEYNSYLIEHHSQKVQFGGIRRIYYQENNKNDVLKCKHIDVMAPLHTQHNQKDVGQAIVSEEYEVRRGIEGALTGIGEEAVAALDAYHCAAANEAYYWHQLIKLKTSGVYGKSREVCCDEGMIEIAKRNGDQNQIEDQRKQFGIKVTSVFSDLLFVFVFAPEVKQGRPAKCNQPKDEHTQQYVIILYKLGPKVKIFYDSTMRPNRRLEDISVIRYISQLCNRREHFFSLRGANTQAVKGKQKDRHSLNPNHLMRPRTNHKHSHSYKGYNQHQICDVGRSPADNWWRPLRSSRRRSCWK